MIYIAVYLAFSVSVLNKYTENWELVFEKFDSRFLVLLFMASLFVSAPLLYLIEQFILTYRNLKK